MVLLAIKTGKERERERLFSNHKYFNDSSFKPCRVAKSDSLEKKKSN